MADKLILTVDYLTMFTIALLFSYFSMNKVNQDTIKTLFSKNDLIVFWLVFLTKTLHQVTNKGFDSTLIVHWMYLSSFLFYMGLSL